MCTLETDLCVQCTCLTRLFFISVGCMILDQIWGPRSKSKRSQQLICLSSIEVKLKVVKQPRDCPTLYIFASELFLCINHLNTYQVQEIVSNSSSQLLPLSKYILSSPACTEFSVEWWSLFTGSFAWSLLHVRTFIVKECSSE